MESSDADLQLSVVAVPGKPHRKHFLCAAFDIRKLVNSQFTLALGL